MRSPKIFLITTMLIYSIIPGYAFSQKAGHKMPSPMDMMNKFIEPYVDTVNGGVYHTLSDDWSTIVDDSKHCKEHYMMARTYVFQNMMSGSFDARDLAKALADLTIKKYEDKINGGFYEQATRDWQVKDSIKTPHLISAAFGTVMHLYEITFDDYYLLKCFDLLDLVLDKCWDKADGGFFDSFTEEWKPLTDRKSVSTQMEIILHLAGAWKDGIDSPYAERAERYKQKSIEITNLVLDKMYDQKNGGFFKSCSADWSVLDDTKDTDAQCAAITTLFFIYHNLGPVIWGPRKGSHAYSPHRPINPVYSYRGPAPDPRPLSMDAYRIGKIVRDTATLLAAHAWDTTNEGFYRSCTADWVPVDTEKSCEVQSNCLTALNIAYKMSPDEVLYTTLKQLHAALLKKAVDPLNNGYFETYSQVWEPLTRNKIFSVNMEVLGALGMTGSTVNSPPLTPVKLQVWIEPQNLTVKDGETARYEVKIQNQGFSTEGVRIGGLLALSRWMEPGEFSVELTPHQVYTYTLKVKPPRGLRGKTYPFEISAIAERYNTTYFSDIAFISIQ